MEELNIKEKQQFIYKPIPIKIEGIFNKYFEVKKNEENNSQNLILTQLNSRRMSAPATLFPENYQFLQQTEKNNHHQNNLSTTYNQLLESPFSPNNFNTNFALFQRLLGNLIFLNQQNTQQLQINASSSTEQQKLENTERLAQNEAASADPPQNKYPVVSKLLNDNASKDDNNEEQTSLIIKEQETTSSPLLLKFYKFFTNSTTSSTTC
uniref:Uncharacterized protein n=1 Tax=Meloidogyne hapla TaxID=6305 RepID=A0A1I8B6H9_MELHA